MRHFLRILTSCILDQFNVWLSDVSHGFINKNVHFFWQVQVKPIMLWKKILAYISVLTHYKSCKTVSLHLSEKILNMPLLYHLQEYFVKALGYLILLLLWLISIIIKKPPFSINFTVLATSKRFLGSNAGHLPQNANAKYTKVILLPRINDWNIYLLEVNKKMGRRWKSLANQISGKMLKWQRNIEEYY